MTTLDMVGTARRGKRPSIASVRPREASAKGRWPRLAVVASAAIVSAVSGYFAVRGVHFGEVRESLASTNYVWLLPALATFVLANVLRILRWRVLFPASSRPAFPPAAEAFLVGQFLNIVLPLRAGEAARIVALNLRTRNSRAEITSTILVERAFDVLGVLALLFLLQPWLPEVSWLSTAVLLAVGLLLVVAAVAVGVGIWSDRPLRFALRPLARLAFFSDRRVDLAAANLVQGLAGFRSARLGAVAFVWTLAAWIVLGLSCWFAMLAFDLEHSPLAGVFVIVAIGLAMILPSAPAAIGLFEAAVVATLVLYDTDRSEALSYALVLHALHVLPFVLVGVPLLHLQGSLVWRTRRKESLA
jgi:glycosyltransferase 2 family protein